MNGFLSFIFFMVLSVWILSMLSRWFISRWLRRKAQQFGQESQRAQRQRDKRQEGDVTVESRSGNNEKRVNQSVGDYVEFEEIVEDQGDKPEN